MVAAQVKMEKDKRVNINRLEIVQFMWSKPYGSGISTRTCVQLIDVWFKLQAVRSYDKCRRVG